MCVVTALSATCLVKKCQRELDRRVGSESCSAAPQHRTSRPADLAVALAMTVVWQWQPMATHVWYTYCTRVLVQEPPNANGSHNINQCHCQRSGDPSFGPKTLLIAGFDDSLLGHVLPRSWLNRRRHSKSSSRNLPRSQLIERHALWLYQYTRLSTPVVHSIRGWLAQQIRV